MSSSGAFAPGKLSIAICDRCKMKVAYGYLRSDPNSPGLRVCREGCFDIYDPWRLSARSPEPITLRHPRPDEALEPPPDMLIGAASNEEIPIATTDGEILLV